MFLAGGYQQVDSSEANQQPQHCKVSVWQATTDA